MTTNDVRNLFLEHTKKYGHVVVPSSPLVPENDPTTLFTGSGMQPMVPYLLGATHPLGKRISDSQKCFRSQDIEEVGDNRHTTFFEMLGNWSLGDFFKDEQIAMMYDFLINTLHFDKNNLYFSCYEGNETLGISKDTFSKEKWMSLGVAEDHIYFYGDKKNWWSRAGVPSNMPVGEPGGPDTEMFYDFDPKGEFKMHEKASNKDEVCNPNCDCGRFMEIGNNVFMQYKKTENGVEELAQKNVDFGGGLERIVAALRGDADVFNIDAFDNAKSILEKISGQKYVSDISVTFTDITNPTFAYRVILDHIRGAVFLIGDGVLPGNKDQMYFVRRLIRRAVRYARNLGIENNFTKEVGAAFIEYYKGAYQNLTEKRDLILEELDKEETKFRKTLEGGIKEFEKILSRNGGKTLSAEDSFNLLQTYGFPIEVTTELAKEKNIDVDLEGFKKLKEEHASASRTASAGMFKGGLSDTEEVTTALHSATHIMLAGMRKVLGDSVHQAGSNITAERLRFDITFDRKIEDAEIKAIEDYVNTSIQNGFKTSIEEMPKTRAKEEGVEGSFWEKYPEVVKVYTMKNENTGEIYSRELCGGPHVQTSDAYLKSKTFKIAKQESVSAGVRRVKGVLE
jgi:alanyl-tRNA synthetase